MSTNGYGDEAEVHCPLCNAVLTVELTVTHQRGDWLGDGIDHGIITVSSGYEIHECAS